MNSAEKILYVTFALEHGIIPSETFSQDMQAELDKLTPEQAQIAKRKFRKLWRRVVRDGDKTILKMRETQTGKGKRLPSRAEKLHRKFLVQHYIEDKFVAPALKNVTSKVCPSG